MRAGLIISLIIAILAVIFALQNATWVTVHLGPWSFEQPLALVLLVTLALGVIIGYLASLPGRRKLRKKLTSAQPSSGPEPPPTPPPMP